MLWRPIAILPNIVVTDSIENDQIVITVAGDPRVQALAEQKPILAKFLRKFSDTHGNDIVPSVILWAYDQTITSKPELEAIRNFRDAVAISHIAFSHSRILSGAKVVPGVLWANYFSLYPWMLALDETTIVCDTPAMLGIHGLSSFKGQSSPELSQQSLTRHECDRPLLDALQRRWVAAWSGGEKAWSDIALFRSLNMAYWASAMPAGSEAATFYDVGRSIALWVSAFEILSHPGHNDTTSLKKNV